MKSVPEVIARRVLGIVGDSSKRVVIQIKQPIKIGNDYRCEYSIEWPQQTYSGYAMGVDELQALILTINHIKSDVRSSSLSKENQLYWLEPNNGDGFV